MKIKYNNRACASLLALAFAPCALHATDSILFEEDFETDGADVRYTVENGSDDGANDYFARRAEYSDGTDTTGGTLSGTYFWAARDIDGSSTGAVAEMDKDEGRITFNSFSISGSGNFQLLLEAAQGGDELEADNTFLIQMSVDGGDWETIGGFRGTGTDSPGRYFVGDADTVASTDDARLTNNFATFAWDIDRIGSTMQFRIKENLNGGDEEYAFDDIRLIGDDSLSMAWMSLSSDSVDEGSTSTLTVTLDDPAPAGGVTLSLSSSDETEATVPSTVTIPEGSTSADVTVTAVADNGFDGDESATLVLSGDGYANNEITLTVCNVDAKPAIVLNEFLTSIPGSLEDDLIGDANGDGVRNGSEDEFLEFVNNDTVDIDMSGWTISDDKGVRHVFPDDTILKAGRAIVIFAGGNPSGLFGGAIVQTATAGNFGYGDTGDVIVLASGSAEVISYDYTDTFPSVYMGVTRNPDITGEYVTYDTVSQDGELFSPGTHIDGTPFGDFDYTLSLSVNKTTMAEDETSPAVATVSLDSAAPAGGFDVTITSDGLTDGEADEISLDSTTVTIPEGSTSVTFNIYAHNDGVLDGDQTVTVVARGDDAVPSQVTLTITEVTEDPYDVVINEAMGSLDGTGLDLNGNGTSEEALNDQFIEIVNNTGRTVDISGWKLYAYATEDTNGEVCVEVFDDGTKIADQGSIVIFGGGDADDINASADTLTGGAVAYVSNNGGVGVNLPTDDDGTIILVNQFGYTIDEVEYDSTLADQGQSITRDPDITGDFGSLHLKLSGLKFLTCSPGAEVDGTAFSGNGAVSETDYEKIFSDYYLFTEDYYYSNMFGWAYVSSWPFLYTYDYNAWIYVDVDDSEADVVLFYDYENGSWFYTTQDWYPWGWDLCAGDWAQLY